MPIPCDVPGAICKNVCSARATDAEVDGEIKYWLKFAAERDGWKKQRLERQTRWATSAAPSCKKVCDHQFSADWPVECGVL